MDYDWGKLKDDVKKFERAVRDSEENTLQLFEQYEASKQVYYWNKKALESAKERLFTFEAMAHSSLPAAALKRDKVKMTGKDNKDRVWTAVMKRGGDIKRLTSATKVFERVNESIFVRLIVTGEHSHDWDVLRVSGNLSKLQVTRSTMAADKDPMETIEEEFHIVFSQ